MTYWHKNCAKRPAHYFCRNAAKNCLTIMDCAHCGAYCKQTSHRPASITNSLSTMMTTYVLSKLPVTNSSELCYYFNANAIAVFEFTIFCILYLIESIWRRQFSYDYKQLAVIRAMSISCLYSIISCVKCGYNKPESVYHYTITRDKDFCANQWVMTLSYSGGAAKWNCFEFLLSGSWIVYIRIDSDTSAARRTRKVIP